MTTSTSQGRNGPVLCPLFFPVSFLWSFMAPPVFRCGADYPISAGSAFDAALCASEISPASKLVL